MKYTTGPRDAPVSMTWKHLLLGAVHNTVTGGHRSATDMASELPRLVAWWPPESLRTDCRTWVDRCKLCASVNSKRREEPMYRATTTYKIFCRIQIDLMEVKPTGVEGERYIFTFIDIASRYPFLRATATRDETAVCEMQTHG